MGWVVLCALKQAIMPSTCLENAGDVLPALILMGSTHTIAYECRVCYNMCTQKPPHDYSKELYAKYRESFSKYIADKV